MCALITVTAALIAGIFLGAAWMDSRQTHRENRELRERIASLEAAQAKRLPYKSLEAIEEFEAGIMYTEQAFEIAQLHLQRVHELGKMARNPDGNGKK